MFQSIRTLLVASVIACGALGIAAQTTYEPEIVKGKIIEKVVVAANPSQSYALYLPTTYDPPRRFPIVYCFDPVGRGKLAVEKYRAAAEKYGYIVVASNNSRNSLDKQSIAAIINNLSDDTERRLSIDPKRVLAAGLSGGARVASLFALSCRGCIFGVIGSSAGLWQGTVVTSEMQFLFFGTAGYDDFNYPEMQQLNGQLAAARIAHRIEYFDGGHEWLPEALAEEALAWYEIRAMKSGRREKDASMIEDQFRSRVTRAENFLTSKKYLEAYSNFIGIIDDFGEWRDVSALTAKVRSLETSAEMKRAIKSDADQARALERVVGEILTLIANLRNPETKGEARMQIRDRIQTLKKDAARDTATSEHRIAARALSQLSIQIMESPEVRAERGENLVSALDMLEIAAEINPKGAQIPFNIARIYALKGDKKRALDALARAVELGLKDPNRITNEKAFEALQREERFVKLLASLKQ